MNDPQVPWALSAGVAGRLEVEKEAEEILV